MNPPETDTAGAIAIPPVIYAVFMAIGVTLDLLFPIPLLPASVQYGVGLALVAGSGCIMPFVLRRFRKTETSFDLRKATTALITGGPYRFSRNPSYVSLSLLYVGIGIAADSVWVLGLFIPTLMVTHYGVILREERYLENKFGEEYLHYKRRVRRWV